MLSLAFISSCLALIFILPPFSMIGFWAVGLTLCVCGLMTGSIWHPRLKPYFPLFYLFTVTYCVPFLASLMFLSTPTNKTGVYLVLNTVLLSSMVGTRLVFALGTLGAVFAYVCAIPLGVQTNLLAHPSVLIVMLILLLIFAVFGKTHEDRFFHKIQQTKLWSGGLGHELKNSAGLMSGFASWLRSRLEQGEHSVNSQQKQGIFLQEKDLASLQELATCLDREGKRALQDINAFTDMIRKDVIQQHDLKPVSLRGLIDEGMDRASGQYNINVHYEDRNDDDVVLPLPDKLFPLVVYNLIKNAYWHGGAKEMTITIDSLKRTVRFKDNGKGIPQEKLSNIFDLFYTGGNGSGIGLYFVKEVIQAAGGTIFCRSQTGAGSFTEFEMSFKDT